MVMNLNSHVIGRPFDDSFEVIWQLVSAKRPFSKPARIHFIRLMYYPEGWYTASGKQPHLVFSPCCRHSPRF